MRELFAVLFVLAFLCLQTASAESALTVNVKHADGSAVAGAYVCAGGTCVYADSYGVARLTLQQGTYTVKATKDYDVSGTKISYYGEKSVTVTGSTSIDLNVMPRGGCFYLRSFQLDKNSLNPGETVTGSAEWVFAKCCPNCAVYAVVYDQVGKEVTRLWQGGDSGYTHQVIKKTFTYTAPSTSGTYCLTLNVAYDYSPPNPSQGIMGRTCFTVSQQTVLDGQIVSVNPSSVSVTPGQSVQFTFTVKNTGNVVSDYHVYFAGGSLFGYVSGTITLNPGQQGQITLTGTVPSGAQPGSYNVDVYFEMAQHGQPWQKTQKWGNVQVNVQGPQPGYIRATITNNDDDILDVYLYIDGTWKLSALSRPPGSTFTSDSISVQGNTMHTITIKWKDPDTSQEYSKSVNVYVPQGQTVTATLSTDLHTSVTTPTPAPTPTPMPTPTPKPPILILFEPQVEGLTVTINGVANPGYEGASITRINWDWGDGSKEDHWFPATHTYSRAGTYIVTVTVYQSDGLSATKTLSVKVGAENKAFQFTASISTDKTEYEKPYEVTFRIDITKGLPGHYNGRILIIDPSSETVDVIKFSMDLEGFEGHIIKKWNAPEDSKPGTYFALLVLEGEHGRISCVTGFYLEDPDKSYVEVLPSDKGVKIIHIHLQRFGFIYSNELPPIDYAMAMKAFKVDLVGIGLSALEHLVSAGKSKIKGVVTPTEPYDLTIIPIYRVGEGYLCLLFESHPLGVVVSKEVKDSIISTIVEFLLKKKLGIEIPSVPVPIEYFWYISKEDYESFTVDSYTILTLPTEVIVKYVEKPRQEYKLGESITAKVQVIDPRTNEPLKGDFDIVACIGPSTSKITSTCVNVKNGVLDGLYTDQVYNTFHSPEYVLYFVVSASGYIGVSQNMIISISSEKALFDISHLSFSINPSSISLSESTNIYISFDISAQVPCQVQVRILKKTFFGLFSAEIARRDAIIGHNDLIISLKGEEIADKFLFWLIRNYDIYAEITATYTPPGSTVPVSYTKTTSVSTINVHS
jgi:PKD repeat protein/plastocyanin